MDQKQLEEMILSMGLEEKIEYESIPNLDLYMDQVTTLFENRLMHTKRYEDDKLITKTMINNYIKDKLLMPAHKKKYTRQHIVLIILLYELKQILTINDIKNLFGMIIRDGKVDEDILKNIYQIYIEAKADNTSLFQEEAQAINKYVTEKVASCIENVNVQQETEIEKIRNMVQVILLTQKADYYKKLAEKIIDENIKKDTPIV